MAYTIIDRTLNGSRSSGNRAKFVRRVRNKIRDQIKKQIADGNIDDLVNGKGRSVTVPKKDLSQPTFGHGRGGRKTTVHPGNKEFVEGDRIRRPPSGKGGKPGGASDSGEGEDSFEFRLTHDEFLDLFFEDCELPDLRETVIDKTNKVQRKRAGFSTDGPVAQLNLERTLRMSKGRRIGLFRKGKKKRLQELEEQEAKLVIDLAEEESRDEPNKSKVTRLKNKIVKVREEIVVLKRKLRAVPFIDEQDLRYNRYEYIPMPTSRAVMFCMMDVSGSMSEWHKEMAKRYFMLQYLFLSRNYETVEVVWIRHTTIAKEVTEEEFFYGRETGGTFVSSGLQKMVEIIEERYPPTTWNIYGSQATDGDNWSEDNHLALDLLQNDLLPISRYFTYIEIDQHDRESDLWPHYEGVAARFPHFQMRRVNDAAEIYPVFRELFRRGKGSKQRV